MTWCACSSATGSPWPSTPTRTVALYWWVRAASSREPPNSDSRPSCFPAQACRSKSALECPTELGLRITMRDRREDVLAQQCLDISCSFDLSELEREDRHLVLGGHLCPR